MKKDIAEKSTELHSAGGGGMIDRWRFKSLESMTDFSWNHVTYGQDDSQGSFLKHTSPGFMHSMKNFRLLYLLQFFFTKFNYVIFI